MVACLYAYRNDSVNREKQILQEKWGEFWSRALELAKGMGSSAQVEGLAWVGAWTVQPEKRQGRRVMWR